jgi:Flp pilus assembly protein TadD
MTMRTHLIAALALALLSAPLHANLGAEGSADWKRAVEHLSKAAAAEPKNADIHNWLGFANRKLGNMDAAFAAYNEALKLDPKHRNAHEYIGEAYLMVNDVAKAEQHLAELQKLCTPIPCEQYKELKRALDEHKKR